MLPVSPPNSVQFVYEVPIAYYGCSYAEGKKIHWYHALRVIWNLVKFRVIC